MLDVSLDVLELELHNTHLVPVGRTSAAFTATVALPVVLPNYLRNASQLHTDRVVLKSAP